MADWGAVARLSIAGIRSGGADLVKTDQFLRKSVLSLAMCQFFDVLTEMTRRSGLGVAVMARKRLARWGWWGSAGHALLLSRRVCRALFGALCGKYFSTGRKASIYDQIGRDLGDIVA